MKNLLLFLVFMVFLAIPGTLAAAGQPVDSDITEVVVFTRDAAVTRSGTVAVEKGAQRLVLHTNAHDIASDSVTAAVFGDGAVQGVQVVRVPVPEAPREDIRRLESEIEALETEKRVLLDAGKTLDKQAAFLDSLVDFSKSGIAGEMKTQMPATERMDAYLVFFDAKFSEIFEKRRSIDGKISSIEKDIEQLRRELSLYRRETEETRTGIEVLFNSYERQDIRIEARYRVNRAGWSPVYRASVDSGLTGVDLAMMAEITQTTGEDWRDVTLTVSNAVPVRVGRLPDLGPWWLDHDKPVPARRDALMMRSPEMAENAAAPPADPVRRETALSFEYTMPDPVTVVSRRQKTLVPVLSRTIDGEFYHYTVPARGPEAYLVCEAEADRELLPGPVNVFFENRYTGRMTLDETGPGDRFTLGLGVDRSVRVAREKTMDKVEETAFFGRVERDSVIRQLSYRVVAENLREAPVILKVVDRVPVSRTDRITVKDVAFSPAPDRRDVDEKAGVMEWDLEIGPASTTGITTGFTVTYPKDMPRPIF